MPVEPILGSRDEDDTTLAAPAADSRDTEAEAYTDTQNLVAVWNTIRRVLGDPAARLIRDSIVAERASRAASVPEGTNG